MKDLRQNDAPQSADGASGNAKRRAEKAKRLNHVWGKKHFFMFLLTLAGIGALTASLILIGKWEWRSIQTWPPWIVLTGFVLFSALLADYVLVLIDRTARIKRLVEERTIQLRDSENKLREAQQLARIGNWEWNCVTGEILWSDEVYRLIGLEPGSVVPSKNTYLEYVHPEDRGILARAVRKSMFTGHNDLIHRIVWSDGSVRFVRQLGRVEFSENNKPIRMFGTTQDITSIKKAEEELILKNAILSAQQEVSIDGILAVDSEDCVILRNRQFCEMWNIPHDLVQSQSDAPILKLVQSRVADPEAFLEKVRYLYNHHRETSRDEIVLADGRVFDRYTSPMFDSDGRYLGRIWYFRDFTDRKRAEKQLEDYAIELETANEALKEAKHVAENATRAKSEFLANMSHEIRTPMTAILGFADILLENSRDGACIEAADTIKRNGNYLLEIINNILDLSKIEAGKLLIEKTACSPVACINEVASLLKIRCKAHNIELLTEFSGPIPETIQTDTVRLQQILINLAGNAIKFTESGSVRIVTSLDRDSWRRPLMRFDVIDTGIGMSDEQIARLFQPFVQANMSTSRRFGGTGLGLTISRRLAELLGGTIRIHSEVGKGSIFTLFIDPGCLDHVPMLSNPTVAAVGEPSQVQPSKRLAPTLDGHVLLVEDGSDNQRLLTFILQRAGAKVTPAEHGQAALDKIVPSGVLPAGEKGPRFAHFDLILMDMQMPVMDGYEATRKLRDMGYRGPIIALTANAMSQDRQKCIEAGCDEYLSKPIDRKCLMALAVKYLGVERRKSAAVAD